MSDLPAPLRSNAQVGQVQPSRFYREGDLGQTIEAYPERANLYPLALRPMPRQLYCIRRERSGQAHEEIVFGNIRDASVIAPTSYYIRLALQQAILRGIQGNPGYKVRTHSLQPLIIDVTHNHSPKKQAIQIVQAYRPRIIELNGSYWLCLDHQLIERSLLRLDKLEQLYPQFHLHPGQSIAFQYHHTWITGKLLDIEGETYRLELPTGEEHRIGKTELVPYLSRMQIARIAPALGIPASEHERMIKQLSFLTIAQAPRARLDACTNFARRLAHDVFPVRQEPISAYPNNQGVRNAPGHSQKRFIHAGACSTTTQCAFQSASASSIASS